MRWMMLLTVVAGSAQASDLTPLTENRAVYLEAQGNSDFGGSQEQRSFSSTDDGGDPFLNWGNGDSIAANGAQSAIASASGFMNTVIAPNFLGGVANVEASATIFDETAYDAFGQASAVMEIGFSLDAGGLWRLTSALDMAGTGVAEVRLTEGSLPGGSVLYTVNTAGWHDQILALGPGEYTLSFVAGTSNWILAQGVLSGSASFDASFTLVPTPGVLTLVAGVPLLARRRR